MQAGWCPQTSQWRPGTLMLSLQLLRTAGIALPNRAVILSILAYQVYWLWILPCYPRTTFSQDYNYGQQASAITLKTFSMLVLFDHQHQFIRIVKDTEGRVEHLTLEGSKGNKAENVTLLRRIIRAFQAGIAVRGVGW